MGTQSKAARRRCGKPQEPAGLGLDTTWVVLEIGVPFRVPFTRVGYCIGDSKKDPKTEPCSLN